MSSSSPFSRTTHLLVRNPAALRSSYPPELRGQYDEPQHNAAWLAVRRLPGYRSTPLHDLRELASTLGLGRIWVKDESERFGLGAFKSTGGAYAVYRVIREKLHGSGERVSVDNLLSGRLKHLTGSITVACASAGNHGRAVAWAAHIFGVRCVVYLYQGVSPGRIRAIQALGATVVATPPDYDHAVQQVAAQAAREGWQIVSDTAYPGYHAIPLMVMDGYSVIAQEVLNELGDEQPTHVFLQAGVGSFAAAMAAHFWLREQGTRPTFVVVEPDGAACVLRSIVAGAPTTLPDVHSIMGGLCCGVMSDVAWDVLRRAVDWSVAIPDSLVAPAMKQLASPTGDDPRIVAGESGVAGLAALLLLARDADARAQLGLDEQSRVLAFVTEGATDPEEWTELTGLEPGA